MRNEGNKPAWIDVKLPVVTNFSFFCEDFVIEVPGAESAHEQWGCGYAGSFGRGFREVLPGNSLSLRQLVASYVILFSSLGAGGSCPGR